MVEECIVLDLVLLLLLVLWLFRVGEIGLNWFGLVVQLMGTL